MPDGRCTSCPARHTVRTDSAAAALAARLISRGAVATYERDPGGKLVGPTDLAVGVTHRDQAEQVRQSQAQIVPALAERVRVDTAKVPGDLRRA